MRYEAEALARAIKDKCMECSGSRAQAKACRLRSCPLWAVTDLQQPRISRAEKRREGVQIALKVKIYD